MKVLNCLLLAGSIILPVLSAWRIMMMWFKRPVDLFEKLQCGALLAIAFNNFCRFWAREGVLSIEIGAPAWHYYAKIVSGLLVQDSLLGLLCLYYLGLLNGAFHALRARLRRRFDDDATPKA